MKRQQLVWLFLSHSGCSVHMIPGIDWRNLLFFISLPPVLHLISYFDGLSFYGNQSSLKSYWDRSCLDLYVSSSNLNLGFHWDQNSLSLSLCFHWGQSSLSLSLCSHWDQSSLSLFVFPLRPKQVEPQLGALDTEAKQEDRGERKVSHPNLHP